MKSLPVILLSLFLFCMSFSAQDQTPIVFQDQAMKQLLLQSNWIFDGQPLAVDADQDGEISVAEAQAVNGELIMEHADLSDATLMSVVDLNQFRNVRELRLKGLRLQGLAQLDLENLELLAFSKCQLETFEQGSYPNLRILSIVETPLTQLELSGLTNLYDIGVVSAGLESLSISGSPEILYVWLDDNQLRDVPLINDSLITLRIADNLLESLPTLPNTLDWLDVRGNNLTTLPALASIEALRHLDVSQNQLTQLPLLPPNLRWLHASENQMMQIENFPTGLQAAYLSHNALTSLPELPDEIFELNLSHNAFSTYPVTQAAEALIYLDLSHNALNDMPPPDQLASGLIRLNLADNLIEMVDVDLPNRIETLILSHNQIRVINTFRPSGLTELHLGGNPLDLSSDRVMNWLNTRNLYLSGGLPEYPDFSKLGSIRLLDLSQGELEQLPPLPRSLRDLIVDQNPVSSLPDLAVSTPYLTQLSANDCQLSVLPKLPTSLDVLRVAGNQLTSLQELVGLVDYHGTINLLEADFSENLLDQDACLVTSLITQAQSLTMGLQRDGLIIDCGWIDRPIEIEDESFRNLLEANAGAFADFHHIDFSDPQQLTPYNLARISWLKLENLPTSQIALFESEILDHLIGLGRLFLSGTPLSDYSFLQYLPRLDLLDVSHSQIEVMPLLPDQLHELRAHHNPLIEIPRLPLKLNWLKANHTLLEELPELPPYLHHVEVQASRLTSLPAMSDRVVSLLISGNPMQELPELPKNLQNLYCHSMGLEALPELPETLRILYAQYNALQTIPALPLNMQTLALSHNQLLEVPPLSVNNEVYLNNNQLRQAPQLLLPSKRVDVSHNPIMDWSAVAGWRDLLNLDIAHTGLISLEPFLSQEALLQVGEAALNLEGNLLTQADCDDIQTLIERYEPLIQYIQQQNESLSCIDTSATVAFADPYFEAFLLSYRLPSYDNIFLDRNNDGLIQVSEAASLKQLYIWYDASYITDLGGIEAFHNLEVISLKGLPGLQTLPDLGALTSLQSLEVPAWLQP